MDGIRCGELSSRKGGGTTGSRGGYGTVVSPPFLVRARGPRSVQTTSGQTSLSSTDGSVH